MPHLKSVGRINPVALYQSVATFSQPEEVQSCPVPQYLGDKYCEAAPTAKLSTEPFGEGTPTEWKANQYVP